MAGDASGVLYEEVPYPGNPFPQTHPDRLATLARLYGLDPTPPIESLAVSAQAHGDAPDEAGRGRFTGANGSNLTTDHAAVIARRRSARSWPTCATSRRRSTTTRGCSSRCWTAPATAARCC